MSAKDKLPGMIDPGEAARTSIAREAWRIFGIMAEFVEATERLQQIRPAVSIFGSARTPPDHPYYARKYMFVRFAAAYVVMPGGFGTVDELMEALTLIQTRKSRSIPVILVHSPFWAGLIDWFRNTLVNEGMISPADMDLVQIIDDPAQIVDAIFRHYENRSFMPLPEEHEAMLNL